MFSVPITCDAREYFCLIQHPATSATHKYLYTRELKLFTIKTGAASLPTGAFH